MKKAKVQQAPREFDAKDYERPGLLQFEILQVKDAFDMFDTGKRGLICPKDLRDCLLDVGFQAKNNTIYQVIMDLVADGTGELDFQEFLHFFTTKVNPGDSRSNMNKVFALFDDDKSGFLSLKQLRRIVKELNLTVSEEELDDMIVRADKDKDGLVSEEEFYELMSRRT